MGPRAARWRGWFEYWRMPRPDAALHYDLRGAHTMTSWLETPLANMGFWDELDPRDPDAIEAANRALFELVAGSASIQPDDHVLDAGAGFAVNAIHLAEQHRARVTGVNVSRVQTDIGIRLVHQAGLEDRIELVIGDATEIPLPDATVDAVISVEAAFHFSSRERFFAEAFRVLRPGGMLSMVDLLPLPPRNPLERAGARILRRALAIPASNFYDAATYAALVGDAGFEEVIAESIVDRTYRPFRRWIGRTVLSQTRGKHPLFAIPSMVYLAYPVDYVRLHAKRPADTATSAPATSTAAHDQERKTP